MDANARRHRSPGCQSPSWTFRCLLCLKLSAESFRGGSLQSSSSYLHSSDICSKRLARSGLLASLCRYFLTLGRNGCLFCLPAVSPSDDVVHKHTCSGGWHNLTARRLPGDKKKTWHLFFCPFHFSLMSVYNLIFSFFSFFFLFYFCTA